MEYKIIEVFKKYSKSVDTEYNVYNCLIEEDWSNIAQEVVKLFRQPAVMPRLSSEWVKFEDEKPPHEVVLAACDTYDCGWTMDTVWWNEKDQVWMVTGSVVTTEAHLPYTHWRKLPPFPNEV